MFKQLKYELMARGTLRLAALGAVILINLGLALIFGGLGVWGDAGEAFAITISSLCMLALMLVALLNDVDALQRLFVAPAAYLALLPPVKPWKLLASRTAINFVQDIVFSAVGILGVCLQVGMYGNFMDFHVSLTPQDWYQAILYGITFIFDYWFLILAIYFGVALTRTVLVGLKGRTALGVLSVFACLWLHNVVNIVLYPFSNGTARSISVFLAFTVDIASIPGGIAMIVLSILKCAALFYATTKLMERKLNV